MGPPPPPRPPLWNPFLFPQQWSGRLEGGQEDKQFCLSLPVRYWLLWFSSGAKRVLKMSVEVDIFTEFFLIGLRSP